MKYDTHNLAQNLESAIKVGDNKAVRDMVISETAELMQSDKPALIAIVRNSGKSISDSISNDKLVDIILEELYDNSNSLFAENLLSVIIQNKGGFSNDVTGIGQIAGAAGQILGGALDLGKQAIESKEHVKIAKEQSATERDAAKKALLATVHGGKTTAKTIKYVTLGVGLVATLGIIAYFVLRETTSEGGGAKK